MRIRDMFPHTEDLMGAIEDIDVMQAWQSSPAYSAAPAEVRDAVRLYLQRLQHDVAGLVWSDPPRADVFAEIERAKVLRAWRHSAAAAAAPMQVDCAVDDAIDTIGLQLAETTSTDPRVLLAQAALLAEVFAEHPLREGMLSRSLLAGLAEARA